MDYLLEATRQQMHKTVDELTDRNLSEIRNALKKQLDILDYALEISSDRVRSTDKVISDAVELKGDDTELEEYEEFEEEAFETDEEDTDEDKEEKPSGLDELAKVFDEKQKGYPFEKKLSGGYLKTGTVSQDIFVPESVIRDMGIEHGDIVRYDGEFFGRSKFTILDKSNRTGNDIESFKYGIVEYDESISCFYVDTDINDRSLRVDYSPQKYILTQKDENSFNIKAGDVVDIAWYHKAFEKARVIWRHNTDSVDQKKPTVSKRIIEFNKNNNESSDDDEEISPILEGYTITLIGLEPHWSKYRKLIEERHGKLVTHSSRDHKTSRTASIKKSDLAVVGISHTSHEASQHTAAKCKQYGVPFRPMEGFGGTTFLAHVMDALNIRDKIHE